MNLILILTLILILLLQPVLTLSHSLTRNVVFVDIGHAGTQAAACSFNKGKLTMLNHTILT